MNEYTFKIVGTISIVAESEEEALELIEFEIGGLDFIYNAQNVHTQEYESKEELDLDE